MFFYTLLALALPLVHALPVIDDDVRVRRALGTGANNSSENSASAKIIVPVVLAAVIFLMLLIVGWWRRRKRLRQVVSNIRNNASATNTSTPAAARTTRTTRTETSTRTPITAPGTGPDAPPRPPRRRRRRRPSQISTKSLPAYNEQAGDEEIVLVRRVERDSMSDEDEDDDDDENPRNSRSVREHARSASETPLLDDASPEMGRASLPSSTRGRSEGGHDEQESHDTHARPEHSNDTSVSFTTTADPTNEPAAPPPNVPEVNPTTTTIPIGDAPPYAEAIRASQDGPGLEQNQHSDVGAVPSTSTNASSPGEADALGTLRPKRRSVFRQFFAINRPGSTSTAVSDSVEMAPTEPRQSLSAPSATNIPATQGAQTRHRPSASISTLASSSRGHGHTLSPSLSSLLLTRSRSPTRSSDSLAQRYNISAPIPTTLLRTELSYPRSGPTPEQIRFLSSRESLGRFGMPYGEEAVAAAALSRENISSLVSPPEYAPAPNATSETQNATITPNSRRARLGSSSLSQVPTIVTTSDTGSESLPEGARTPSPPRAASPSPESIETANQNAPLDESTMRAHTPDQPDRSNPAADSVMTTNDRRDSMFSTNSFVTADEGDRDTLAEAREEADSGSDTSPPTPTVETYRQADDTIQATQSTDHQADVARQRPRGQTILVPGSNTGDEVPHPELSFIPATPTVDGPIRVDDGA